MHFKDANKRNILRSQWKSHWSKRYRLVKGTRKTYVSGTRHVWSPEFNTNHICLFSGEEKRILKRCIPSAIFRAAVILLGKWNLYLSRFYIVPLVSIRVFASFGVKLDNSKFNLEKFCFHNTYIRRTDWPIALFAIAITRLRRKIVLSVSKTQSRETCSTNICRHVYARITRSSKGVVGRA